LDLFTVIVAVTPRSVPDGPVRRLFDELLRLYRLAGEPSTRTLAKAVGFGHATVHVALRGPRVPRWGLLELLVEALGGDVDRFRQLWIDARDAEDPQVRPHWTAGSAATSNEATRRAPAERATASRCWRGGTSTRCCSPSRARITRFW
jgi:hypothetical protein